MEQLDHLIHSIRSRAGRARAGPALLVGLSGIDGAGKGFVAGLLRDRLRDGGLRVAAINVDGWLALPEVRFAARAQGEHFYHHALRLDAMFEELVLPVRRDRAVDIVAAHAEETATAFRPRRYVYHDVDVVLLEGIFIFKRAYRQHFDLAVWVECSFETALERALRRGQERLPREETRQAYAGIYFPAQRLHLMRDDPRGAADQVLLNDARLEDPAPRGARFPEALSRETS